MVFQNYALYPHMTIAENMGFSLRLARKSKAEITERVSETARILGLADYLDRFPKQLSGGQRQRVAMGRAIVRNPRVFLFDEPLSNLDAKLRVQMRAELKDLHSRLKTTTIYVTHDQIEAMTMADRIVVMRDGVVEQVGAPLDLYDHPANIFVAGFIGSPAMNFITGRIETGNGQPAFVSAAGSRLPVTAAAANAAGNDDVVYGIRPEHLSVAPDGTGIAATVAVLEPTGSETTVVARLGEDQIVALLRERIAAHVGDAMPLQVDPANSHLFDAATGQRLG
jgi:multiple sugar transport system ATP-binding protein